MVERELQRTIDDLKRENADLRAERISLHNMIRDMKYCHLHTWCDNTCKHFKGGDQFCGLGIDERLREMGL